MSSFRITPKHRSSNSFPRGISSSDYFVSNFNSISTQDLPWRSSEWSLLHSNRGSQNKRTPSSEPKPVDFRDAQRRLKRLRPLSSVLTRDLKGSSLDDYQTLVSYTKLLYEEDLYTTYLDKVREIFGDLQELEPGTVGAYFAGCLMNIGNPTVCSVICSGRMPSGVLSEDILLPKDAGEHIEFCPYTVILAISNGSGYKFNTLYEGEDPSTLIMYIDTKGQSFTGFNDEERDALSKYRAKKIQIYRYTKDGKNYTDITNGTVSFAEIPSRVDILAIPASTPTGQGSLLIILLIFLVLVAVFIGWRIWASKQ